MPKLFIKIFSALNKEIIVENVQALPDTGADVTLIPYKILREEDKSNIQPMNHKLLCANNAPMKIVGTLSIYLQAGKRTILISDAYISKEITQPIISFDSLVALELLPANFPQVNAVSKNLKTEIEKLILDYSDIFDEESLKPMKFPPLKLELIDPSAKPFHAYTARVYPHHIEEAAKKELKRLCDLGIIERAPGPSEHCAHSFFIKKSSGAVRLIADFSQLSKNVKRSVHPFPCVQDILRGIKHDMKYFAAMDLKMGYFQIALHEDSKPLTTFLTPLGKYRFQRCPMGLNESSDVFNYAGDMALLGVPNSYKLVDDLLTGGDSEGSLIKNVKEIFQRCRDNGIQLNRAKLQFGDEVVFAGHIISKDGVRCDPKKLAALKEFPQPKDLTTLRGFLGLANQLAIGIPSLAMTTGPLRELLRKDVAFLWQEEQQQAFQEVKDLLTSDRVVSFYDPRLPTELMTDSSRSGTGYSLIQWTEGEDSEPRLIQCGSRSLTDCETRYSVSELELLGVVYATKACKHYLISAPTPFAVIVDHKAILGLLTKPLQELDGRLLRLREKLLHSNFTVAWRPGKLHFLPDCLSRHPVDQPSEEDVQLSRSLQHAVLSVQVPLAQSDDLYTSLLEAAQEDSEYQRMLSAVAQLERSSRMTRDTRKILKDYLPVVKDLSVYENVLVLYKHKIVLPINMMRTVVENLHLGHCGISKMTNLFRTMYYFPKYGDWIEDIVANCDSCQRFATSQTKESTNGQIEIPNGPMDICSADLFQFNNGDYIILVDHYSQYFWFKHLSSLTSISVINFLLDTFTRVGFCRLFCSDQGRQFISGDFKEFCDKYHITRKLSSPYFPISNGNAEMAVKRCKGILKKTTPSERNLHFLAYFNAPLTSDTKSPAQLFFGRTLRIPGRHQRLPKLLDAPDRPEDVLPPLKIGQRVRLRDPIEHTWFETGHVLEARRGHRSYLVELEGPRGGMRFVRNRIYLKPIKDASPSSPQH